MLKENGLFGMIVPNKFLKIDTAKKLREHLLKINKKISIVDFGDAQLFDDKTIYSSLLYITNGDYVIDYCRCKSIFDLAINKYENMVNESLNEMSSDVWVFSKEYYLTFSDNFTDLSSICKIFNGIQTSMENPHIYWFNKKQIIEENSKFYVINFNNKKYSIEKSITRPYFKPINKNEKGACSFDILETDKIIIYPYRKNGKLIDIKDMKSKYKNTYSYLLDYYNILVPKQININGKRDVPNATLDTWYQYGRSQGLTAFNDSKKIIVRNLFKEPLFALDETNMLLSSGGTAGYSAIKMKNNLYSIEYIQAFLNSPITIKILKDIASQFEGGFYAVGTSKLNKLRIPKLDFNNPNDIELHRTIVLNIEKIRDISKRMLKLTRKNQIEILSKKRNIFIKENNNIIESLYKRSW